MATEDLLTLAEAKDHLGLSVTTYDALLTALITAGSRQLEDHCRTAFVKRSFVEYHTGGLNGRLGGAKRIALGRSPVDTAVAITIADESGATVAATEYTVVIDQALLEHASTWPTPVNTNARTGRWKVTYTAGRFAATANVTEDVKTAGRLLVAERFARRQPGVAAKAAGDLRLDYLAGPNDGRLSPEVEALIAPYARPLV